MPKRVAMRTGKLRADPPSAQRQRQGQPAHLEPSSATTRPAGLVFQSASSSFYSH